MGPRSMHNHRDDSDPSTGSQRTLTRDVDYSPSTRELKLVRIGVCRKDGQQPSTPL